MYLAELPWRRGCSPLSEVTKKGSSVFSLFSLIKLHLASLPLASSYSHVAVSSVFCAQNIYFSAKTRGAPLSNKPPTIRNQSVHAYITCKSIIDTTNILRLLPLLSYFRPVVM